MKRVKIYKPKIEKKKITQYGQTKLVLKVTDKRHEFIKELGVMDRTLAEFTNVAGDEDMLEEIIIARKLFIEEVKEESLEAEQEPKKRGRKPKTEE